jgi:hypothetical protein
MSFKVYATKDEIPDTLRDSYKEVGGKWYPDVEGIREHPEVLNLKRAHDTEKEEFRKFKAKYKDLPEDFDLEDYRKIKAEKDQAERDKLTKAGEFDKREAELVKKHNEEIARRDERESRRIAAMKRRALESAARRALDGKAISVELQLPHVMAELEAVENEDTLDFDPFVLDPADPKRKAARIMDGKGTKMTIEQLVDEQLDRPHFLANKKGGGGSGSGSPIGAGPGGGPAETEVRKLPGARMVEAAMTGGKSKAK